MRTIFLTVWLTDLLTISNNLCFHTHLPLLNTSGYNPCLSKFITQTRLVGKTKCWKFSACQATFVRRETKFMFPLSSKPLDSPECHPWWSDKPCELSNAFYKWADNWAVIVLVLDFPHPEKGLQGQNTPSPLGVFRPPAGAAWVPLVPV